ncbi:MAG: ABC transporter ATP-binding protein [Alphaproteobacteria bacterium]|jgi:branched-chain amino acid transport system ATP-binding protein
MTAPLLEVIDLTKRFGGFTALRGVALSVGEGERLGLIGPNGSGKTTLINCISGLLKADEGEIHFAGRDISGQAAHRRTRLGIARSFQIPKPFAKMSVLENVRVPLEYAVAPDQRAGDPVAAAREVLGLVGLDHKAGVLAGTLNQIELRKLELTRALAAGPRLLISDEAMAGLSSAEVDEILALLFDVNKRRIAIIMIEHIMRAVMGFCERIVVLDAGTIIADGTPTEIQNDAAVERAYLGD